MNARTLAAVIVTALAVAGCGAAASSTTVIVPPHGTAASGPVTAVPANPVTVLRLTGATPDKGEKYGTMGVENDQVAHGSFPGGEQVWVFTYDTPAHRAYWVAHPVSGPQDGETYILGPQNSLITVDAVSLTDAGGPSAQQIAVKAGGTVLPR